MSSKSEVFEFSGGGGGRSPLLGGVTCDLPCPFLNSDELFQSKVMCENFVRVGGAFQELFEFSGGGGGGGGEPFNGGYM